MKEILDITRFLFDDLDFIEVEKILKDKNYIELVNFIENERELTEILSSFDENNIELIEKRHKLNKIDHLILELYLGVEVIQKINE